MNILPLLTAGLALAACEPLLPVGNEPERDFGEVDAMQAAPRTTILGATPIPGTDRLLAEVGWPAGRRGEGGADIRTMSASGESYRSNIANIVILDQETGASVSLLPNERNRVREARILWPVAGVADGNAPARGEGTGGPAPTHFMLDAELGRGGPGARRLLIGSLDDFTSSLVARGYVAIHHAQMLDATRLSLLVGYPDRDELLVVNLPERRIERRRLLDPARVAR